MAEITTLDEAVPVNAAVGQPNFTGAMTNLASSPSVLAQVGAQVAGSATMKLMQEKGLELGKEPQGNLPVLPINDYMKQLESSYNAQSQAVLSLRANDAINKANEEMARNPAINSDDIRAYQGTLKTTLDDIAKMAPSGIKEGLENSFGQTLQNNTHQYILKMDAQNRKEAIDTQIAYNDEQQSKMQEAALSGDKYGAVQAFLDKKAQLQDLLESHAYSQQEHDAELKKTEIAFQQFSMMRDAFEAEKKHGAEGIEKYLANMENNKPDDMTYADYSIAMQGVYSAVQQRQTYKQSNRSMMISDAVSTVQVTGQPLSIQQQKSLENELTTQQFNETMFRINSILNQKNTKMSAEDALYANRANATAWESAGRKAQFSTFDRMIRDEQAAAVAKGDQLTELQAMANAARSMPVAALPYPTKLSHKIGTGSAEEALEAARQYYEMSSGNFQDAARVSPMDDKAKVAASYMMMDLGKDMSPQDKVAFARDKAYNRTKEKNEAIASAYGEFKKDNLSTTEKSNDFVYKVTGVHYDDVIHAQSTVQNDIIATHEKYFNIAGGDEDIAMKMTQDYVDRHYGYTQINGKREYVLNPVENMGDNPSSQSVPLIQEDAVMQLQGQLALNNERYKQGLSDFHYEIMMPKAKDGTELSYQNYFNLFQAAQNGGATEEGKIATERFNAFLDEYYSEKAIKIKVTRAYNEPEIMDLNIYPSRTMQLSDDHKSLGGFDVSLRSQNGLPVKFGGWTSGDSFRVHYIADIGKISKQLGSIPAYHLNRLPVKPMDSSDKIKSMLQNDILFAGMAFK